MAGKSKRSGKTVFPKSKKPLTKKEKERRRKARVRTTAAAVHG